MNFVRFSLCAPVAGKSIDRLGAGPALTEVIRVPLDDQFAHGLFAAIR